MPPPHTHSAAPLKRPAGSQSRPAGRPALHVPSDSQATRFPPPPSTMHGTHVPLGGAVTTPLQGKLGSPQHHTGVDQSSHASPALSRPPEAEATEDRLRGPPGHLPDPQMAVPLLRALPHLPCPTPPRPRKNRQPQMEHQPRAESSSDLTQEAPRT